MGMSVIIDRRPLSGKSAINRERFIRRFKGLLKHQVDSITNQRSIRDVDIPAEVEVQILDVSEPHFVFASDSGQAVRVLPGNDQYNVGDRIPKKGQGEGGEAGEGDGAGEGGGDGVDSFRFVLSREEYVELLFDGLELPELLRKELAQVVEQRPHRAGITHYGNPSTMSVPRTMQSALARRIAITGARERQVDELNAALSEAQASGATRTAQDLADELKELTSRPAYVPFVDDVDLRYRGTAVIKEPKTAAVMFCLMDVSGSMDELRKDLAKRFFTLLYMFLRRKYENVEIVFIRHTDVAEECDENTFFNDPKSGTTLVLSALKKMHELVLAKYNASQWNIFGAQCSDGDSFGNDSHQSVQFLTDKLLPLTRYFVYAETNETGGANTSLWTAYRQAPDALFKMTKIHSRAEVYPALADLFAKE